MGQKGTMGEMTVVELLDSIQRELEGLSAKVDKITPELADGGDAMILRAYVGSISARTANIQIKIGG